MRRSSGKLPHAKVDRASQELTANQTRVSTNMKPRVLFFAALLLVAAIGPITAQRPEALDFLAGLEEFRTIRNMLSGYLRQLARAKLDEREHKIARFSTAQDVSERKAYIREKMLQALGGFPDRTPLNAR